MKKKNRFLKIIGWTLLGVLAILFLVPFLIPLSQASQTIEKPFWNSEFVNIGENSFHYRHYPAAGERAKGKILFVHGLGGSTFSYEGAAPKLAEAGWFVVSADLPGFGYSSRNPDYNHEQTNRAKDLWAMLEGIDLELEPALAGLPWYLSGHSMGGGTVTAMALSNEARSAGLILIDPALSPSTGGGAITGFPPAVRLMQVALERFLLGEGGVKRFLTSAYGRVPTQVEINGYLAPLTRPGTAKAAGNLFKTAGGPDAARLNNTTLPILAFWGSEDTWVPPAEAQKLTEIRPDALIHIVEGAAHCPMETHTEEFVSTLLHWLDGQK